MVSGPCGQAVPCSAILEREIEPERQQIIFDGLEAVAVGILAEVAIDISADMTKVLS